MNRFLPAVLLLPFVPALGAGAQSDTRFLSRPVDVAVMFSAERAQYSYGDHFWMTGGSGEIGVQLRYRLGLAINTTGVRSSGDIIRQSFSKVMTTAGPRYTLPLPSIRSRVFAEGLFGGVHGFDSAFPAANGPLPSANAFAMQAGGGIDIDIRHSWAIRALDVHYVRTDLPNGATDRQHDLLIGSGIVWRPVNKE